MAYFFVMDDPSHSEVVHLKVDEHLPVVPSSFPAAEILKQILEQMLENERRRVRNEFIRISSFFLLLLLLIMGGGFWIARDILNQVKEARLMSEHSQEALMTLLAAAGRNELSAFLPAKTSQPGVENASSAENPSAIQKSIANLEDKNKALTELMQTQNADIKNLVLDVLKSRYGEIQDLRSRIDSKQARVINTPPLEAETASLTQPPEKGAPPAVTVNIPDRPLINNLTVPVSADLPLRLPIPSPP